ncbi:hypothetical protein [Lysinibacillus sp. 54212]|uniref:hypothetical protein n=1 Tax=Lysinibacillus sp. 54212 TaxID=3119829 RepID=UPI002FC7537F
MLVNHFTLLILTKEVDFRYGQLAFRGHGCNYFFGIHPEKMDFPPVRLPLRFRRRKHGCSRRKLCSVAKGDRRQLHWDALRYNQQNTSKQDAHPHLYSKDLCFKMFVFSISIAFSFDYLVAKDSM